MRDHCLAMNGLTTSSVLYFVQHVVNILIRSYETAHLRLNKTRHKKTQNEANNHSLVLQIRRILPKYKTLL